MTINDVYIYAGREQALFLAQAGRNGYEPISTFFADLSYAEAFWLTDTDRNAIRNTYAQIVKEWSADYKMLTEFVLCLNWKIWEAYERRNDELGLLYDSLWRDAVDIFEGKYINDKEACEYYFKVTD